MEAEQLLAVLSNININSETIEVIMSQYLKFKYIQLIAGNSIVFCLIFAFTILGFKFTKEMK